MDRGQETLQRLRLYVWDDAAKIIKFAHIDSELGFPPGTAKEGLVEAAEELGFRLETLGTEVVKFKVPTDMSNM